MGSGVVVFGGGDGYLAAAEGLKNSWSAGVVCGSWMRALSSGGSRMPALLWGLFGVGLKLGTPYSVYRSLQIMRHNHAIEGLIHDQFIPIDHYRARSKSRNMVY